VRPHFFSGIYDLSVAVSSAAIACHHHRQTCRSPLPGYPGGPHGTRAECTVTANEPAQSRQRQSKGPCPCLACALHRVLEVDVQNMCTAHIMQPSKFFLEGLERISYRWPPSGPCQCPPPAPLQMNETWAHLPPPGETSRGPGHWHGDGVVREDVWGLKSVTAPVAAKPPAKTPSHLPRVQVRSFRSRERVQEFKVKWSRSKGFCTILHRHCPWNPRHAVLAKCFLGHVFLVPS